MRTTALTSSLIACMLMSGTSIAATAKPDAKKDVPAEIKKALEARYPNAKVVDITPSPIAGLYEVFTGDTIFYASPNGDFIVAGPVVSTSDKRNVTAERMDALNSIDLASLPLDLAIKTVKGAGSRTLFVFADPDCPFCKELEHSIAAFDDVTIYTFLFPITSLHPDAAVKAHAIWCAEDRSGAWTHWMLEGTPAKAKEGCTEDPIDEVHALAGKLHIGSTPVVFFANGSRVAGSMTAEQLKRKFDSLAASNGVQPAAKTSSTQQPESKTAAGSAN